jgi:Nuclear cap-binding protein subunit 3
MDEDGTCIIPIFRDCCFIQLLDLSYRANALLFSGPPISHLPTARLFAYATHFDAHPMGLEWIDDNTCVFVFDSKAAARSAHRFLQKTAAEDADDDGFIMAKPIPVALWPPEERINKSLGKGEGLKGIIRMRWARSDDVKKKGAKKDSEFYKKHGVMAGKEVYGERAAAPQKRRRQDFVVEDELQQKALLDHDLDSLVARDSPSPPPSPPSKMRSDYISKDGKTLLERTSLLRIHPTSLEDSITAPLPRRARGYKESQPDDGSLTSRLWGHEALEESADRPKGRRKRPRRGHKSQQELDDELEAFLNERQ